MPFRRLLFTLIYSYLFQSLQCRITADAVNSEVFFVCIHGNTTRLTALLDSGVDVNEVFAHTGETLLHAACHGMRDEIAVLLLERNADYTILNKVN